MGPSQGGVLYDAARESRRPDLEADRLVSALAVSGAEAAVCSALESCSKGTTRSLSLRRGVLLERGFFVGTVGVLL